MRRVLSVKKLIQRRHGDDGGDGVNQLTAMMGVIKPSRGSCAWSGFVALVPPFVLSFPGFLCLCAGIPGKLSNLIKAAACGMIGGIKEIIIYYDF